MEVLCFLSKQRYRPIIRSPLDSVIRPTLCARSSGGSSAVRFTCIDPNGEIVPFSKLKAFTLKENINVFTDKAARYRSRR
jgi:hypothetical protein